MRRRGTRQADRGFARRLSADYPCDHSCFGPGIFSVTAPCARTPPLSTAWKVRRHLPRALRGKARHYQASVLSHLHAPITFVEDPERFARSW